MNQTVDRLILAAAFLAASTAFAAPHHRYDDDSPFKDDEHTVPFSGPVEQIMARPPLHLTSASVAAPAGYYTATQIRHAYGLDKLKVTGAGQIIAVVEAYGSPTLASDMQKFSTAYKLAPATLKIYYPQGTPVANSGWALETSLDAEWAHAIAPDATIAVVVAKSAAFNDLMGAVDYAYGLGAKQISMSWGAAEFPTEASYDTHFNHPGVAFVASSGDNGAGVQWPAISTYVTSVGGTTLKLDAAGNVLAEAGWSGSGGGLSSFIARPVYQSNWQTSRVRTNPDLSYNADPATGFPVYISNYNGMTGWFVVGGTSAGAPQVAAIFALANASRKKSMTSSNTALYSSALANYLADFRDVATGSDGLYTAAHLYDFVTGLGSPISNLLVPSLVAQ